MAPTSPLTSLLQQRHRNILENGVRTEKPDGIGPLYFDAAKTFQTLQPQQRARYFGQAPLLARSAARAYRPPWDRRERYPTTAEAGADQEQAHSTLRSSSVPDRHREVD